MKYVLALDQGTTSSRAIVFDHAGRVHSMARREIAQVYPRPGWVEQDPMEIWAPQIGVAREALAGGGISAGDIGAIGIANQRETTIVWDRETGEPAPMEFEVIREWIPRDVGVGLEIVVDESTTKNMVLELGEYFRREYANELYVFIAIFNNEEAARNRNSLSYPEEKLTRQMQREKLVYRGA